MAERSVTDGTTAVQDGGGTLVKKAIQREMVLVERKVIDEPLIRKAVLEELESEENGGQAVRLEEVVFPEVTELMLSFKNVFCIDNLRGFEKLTKLQLDNNIIEEIKNLDHLVNLKWLDLSFNNITKIEGLENLTNLEDLSLFNNKIEKITGLDKLVKLNVLSLGNNLIESLEDIHSLRDFQNLRLLNLKGNPVCKEDDYHHTVFAYLTRLKYLDYELIEAAQFEAARNSNLGDELAGVEEKEKDKAARKKAHDEDMRRQALHAEANLAGMEMFFDTMCDEDPDHKVLLKLPGLAKLVADYRVAFETVTSNLIQTVLLEHKNKKEEQELFGSVQESMLQENEKESIAKIQAFERRRKAAFKAYTKSLNDTGEPNSQVLEDLKADVENLYDELMGLEVLLVEQMYDLIAEFEEAYKVMVERNVATIGNAFRELAEAEGKYNNLVHRELADLMEKMHKEEKPFEDQPEVFALLSDRDSIKGSVATSNDNHSLKIANKEDSVTAQEKSTSEALYEKFRMVEYERNRFRVAEISELVTNYKNVIQDKLDLEPADEDEDGNYGMY
jgi:hypothetical protein